MIPESLESLRRQNHINRQLRRCNMTKEEKRARRQMLRAQTGIMSREPRVEERSIFGVIAASMGKTKFKDVPAPIRQKIAKATEEVMYKKISARMGRQ